MKTSKGCGPSWWPSRWRPKYFHNACVNHDKDYETGVMDRALADKIFLWEMLACSTTRRRKAEAYMWYYSVRLLGWAFYNRGCCGKS